jgi:DNA-directed RNA polymerase specialized sigma subunit|tara:strand:+ start:7567 stop:7755 length:189 start_codon:yes stop_codon:yes gene_type:complete
MKRRYNNISELDDNKIKKIMDYYYQTGDTIHNIGEKFNFNKSTISKIIGKELTKRFNEKHKR